jgi:pSer/pThr/pTyr-binding forkhead associated (FHA) protein
MHALTIETGKHKGKRLKLPVGESVIGRDNDVGIRIASQDVSRRHCLIVVSEDSVLVRDLESSNGTFVNGAPISGDTALNPGDLLVVGPMGFRYQSSSEDAAAKTSVKPKPSRPGKDPGLSDDDIANFLTDGSEDASATDDTTEIGSPLTGIPPAAPPPKKKTFRSVAEEAADIIRRHRESLQANQ